MYRETAIPSSVSRPVTTSIPVGHQTGTGTFDGGSGC